VLCCAVCLQFLNDGLTFAGTMLLNLLVQHLEVAQTAAPGSNSGSNGGSSSSGVCGVLPWCVGPGAACWGYWIAGLLGASVLAKAIIGSHYNYGLNLVTIR